MYDDDVQRQADVILAQALRLVVLERHVAQLHGVLKRMAPSDEEDILDGLEELWVEDMSVVDGAFYAEDRDALLDMMMHRLTEHSGWSEQRCLLKPRKSWRDGGDDGDDGGDDDDTGDGDGDLLVR